MGRTRNKRGKVNWSYCRKRSHFARKCVLCRMGEESEKQYLQLYPTTWSKREKKLGIINSKNQGLMKAFNFAHFDCV